ncbi:hypothetical protein ACQP00_06355 [Dactylosporangium sp. CS-047395]|uniref:hypothetical protein n=1 Tax=Dactylosporangium sp. CS-047395 TaxID=3239936 RepID=UPI003D8FC3D3
MTPHTSWCAGGHRCSLGEHRADPIVITAPNIGAVTLTRVRAANGREHAEVRLTVALAPTELAARRQLLELADNLSRVLHHATRPEGSIHHGTVAA